MTLPRGFTYRFSKGIAAAHAVRVYIDFPLPEGEQVAATVAHLALTESTRTGEPVSAQSVLRRAVRRGLPLLVNDSAKESE